jgi:hypothetical protein
MPWLLCRFYKLSEELRPGAPLGIAGRLCELRPAPLAFARHCDGGRVLMLID